jgi:hypothetical protein
MTNGIFCPAGTAYDSGSSSGPTCLKCPESKKKKFLTRVNPTIIREQENYALT